MTRRKSRDWNEGLMEDLRRDKDYAAGFVIAVMEEGLSPQLALKKIVKAYGVKEYAKQVNMAASNVLRAINLKHNPTLETLNRLLAPLDLQLAIVPITKKKMKRPVEKKRQSQPDDLGHHVSI